MQAYAGEHVVLATEDFEIRVNERFRPQPSLFDADGPIGEFRRWAERFYS